MSRPKYLWRRLAPEHQEELLAWRKDRGQPWHSPPHRPNYGSSRFHVTAACYEHRPHIGLTPERMDAFASDLLAAFAANAKQVFAWCLLPNHYHALVEAPDILALLGELGKLHGRASYQWNGAENSRGRKVFYRAAERAMRSDRHYWATLNYVHHNPVHHRYVESWKDWTWGSAPEYLRQNGSEEAERVWRDYPLGDYGKGWDDPEM